MDLIEIRMYELEFLELCKRLHSVNNSLMDIKSFFKLMSNYCKAPFGILNELTKEIFEKRYAPREYEIVMLFNRKSTYTNKQIAHVLNMSERKVYRLLERHEEIYPRTTKEQQDAICELMMTYEKMFKADYLNLL
ncbi:MAG: hypothetical protein MJ191_00025 [Clostridium sp.]|nr:hypothetical protein [Clostridium sp.]